jgi:hypothetical protein
MNNKYNSIAISLDSRTRLSEVGSLLAVAITRLHAREREGFSKNSLDFSLKSSVTAALTKSAR